MQRTRAAIIGADGATAGVGDGGGTGGWRQDLATAQRNLAAAVMAAFSDAHRRGHTVYPGQVRGACLAIAGMSGDPARRGREEPVGAGLDLQCAVTLTSDRTAAWMAGTLGDPGVVLAAGSAFNFYGRGPDGREAGLGLPPAYFMPAALSVSAGGAGWALIGRAMAAPPDDPVGRKVAFWFGLPGVAELVAKVLEGKLDPGAPARAVLLAAALAKRGVPEAAAVLADSGRELGRVAVWLLRYLGLDQGPYPVVAVGELFDAGPPVTGPLTEALHAACPQAMLRQPLIDPALGAALAALQGTGVAITPDVRRRLLGET